MDVAQFAAVETFTPFAKNAYPTRHDDGGAQVSVTEEAVCDFTVTDSP